jgi:Mlc titration factor MtfA (ptsG expression regulator)
VLSSLRKVFSRRSIEIPQALWDQELRNLPWLPAEDRERDALRTLCSRFLAEKSMTGVAGLELSAPMQLHIAAQACVPILRLGMHWYEGWSGVVVYPAAFRVHRRIHDASGLVQEFDADLSGEAWDGGPVVLSWEDAAPSAQPHSSAGTGATDAARPSADQTAPVGNVVIHEFAHKLDLLDGQADGIPPFDPHLHPGLQRAVWQQVLEDAYERFCAELDLVEAELPAHVDPESSAADRYYAHLPLDAYAATDPAEFFAVSSEAHFVRPQPLAAAFPQWRELLRQFYRPS